MSYNKFLNNKVSNSRFTEFTSVLSMENRDSTDYFFNKSDLDKMAHFIQLISSY